MKKKRLRLVTTIALLAALAGGSGGVAWGQLSPSAIDNAFGAGESAFIKQGTHSTQQVSAPWSIAGFNYFSDALGTITSPSSFTGTFTDHNLGTTPPDIQLGGVNNLVIRAYTGNGFALGWISILNKVASFNHKYSACNTNGHTAHTGACDAGPLAETDHTYENNVISPTNRHTTPVSFCGSTNHEIHEFSFNKTNIGVFGTGSAANGAWHVGSTTDVYAPCGNALFQARNPDPLNRSRIEVTTHIRVDNSNNGSTITNPLGANNGVTVGDPVWIGLNASPTTRPIGLYTSTIDGRYQKTWADGTFKDGSDVHIEFPIDDDVALVQFSGTNMMDGSSLGAQPTHKLKSDKNTPLGSNSSLSNWGDVSTTQNSSILSNYRRPTTIVVTNGAMGGSAANHIFNSMIVKDIEWSYTVDSVKATSNYITLIPQHKFL